jgi:hypothetical protein
VRARHQALLASFSVARSDCGSSDILAPGASGNEPSYSTRSISVWWQYKATVSLVLASEKLSCALGRKPG